MFPNPLDYERICRICFSSTAELLELFDQGEPNISSILMSLATISIVPNDGMPQKVCSLCVHQANSAFSFILKCKESDRVLRMNMLNVKKIEEKAGIDDSFDDDGVTLCDDVMDFEADDGSITTEKFTTKIENNKEMSRDICDEKFTSKSEVANKIKVENLVVCPECRAVCTTSDLLTEHMDIHHQKMYECEMCASKFYRIDTLNQHLKRHNLCEICGKGFVVKSHLDRHALAHEREKSRSPLKCNVCGKQLKYINHLKVHMRTHRNPADKSIEELTNATTPIVSNKKDILCTVCGKKCSSRSNMAVHMRRHSGEMSNFCSICGKGYPRTTDLTIHMRKHTGEKPFVCNICNRGFARSDKLAIHMRVHTGEKPYACTACGRAFAQSNDLASHRKRNVCGAVETQNEQQCESGLETVS